MRHEESQIQIAFIDWVKLQYPHLLNYILHIPNGGKMSPWKGVHLKRMGVQAGVADILFMWHNLDSHGLWLEFKAPKGKVSSCQLERHEMLGTAGNKVLVVRDWVTAVREVKKFFPNIKWRDNV